MRTNSRGKEFERSIKRTLEEAGYEFMDRHQFIAMKALNQAIYSQQFEIGKDMFGKDRKCDFILYHPRKIPNCLALECKWQSSSGSIEEKFPFLVMSIQLNEYPAIILLDGGGYSKKSKQWLLGQAGKNQLKHVFDLGEFQRYVSKGNI